MIQRILVAICILTSLATASVSQTVEKIEEAWRSWMENHDIGSGTLAVAYDGKVVLESGVTWAADQTAPLASLSKLVTGLCILDLVNKGKLRFDASIGELLPEFETARGAEHMTLGGILTHSAGLGNDRTQKKMPLWLGGEKIRHEEVARHTIRKGPHEQIKGTHFYNNENYAILGYLIERATGENYATYCAREVLHPAGVTSEKLSVLYGGFAAWGGWEMKASDVLRFSKHGLSHVSPYGQSPFDFPHAEMSTSIYYGLGTVFREWNGGHNFWHFGAYCIDEFQAGTYFVHWTNGYSVAVLTDTCFDQTKMIALDRAMIEGAFQ